MRKIRHTLLLSGALALISGCLSTGAMTPAEKDAAMAKCFDQFKNYPAEREVCINRVRTADDAQSTSSGGADARPEEVR